MVLLPAAKPGQASTAQAGFASDLRDLFDAGKKTAFHSGEAADEPEWADVSMDSPDNRHIPIIKAQTSSQEEFDILPDVATIQRPEELTKKPPYWLIVRQEGKSRVVIEGSHAPSLVVLEAYMKKWCRGDTGRVDRVCSAILQCLSCLETKLIQDFKLAASCGSQIEGVAVWPWIVA
jgi:hypothetical protein